MQARPRNAENRLAEELTKASKDIVNFTFIRKPVIGREGPDLTWPNPYQLAIDCKTRGSVPKGLLKNFKELDTVVYYTDRYVMCRVNAFPVILNNYQEYPYTDWHSVQVEDWMDHMDEWAIKHNGIPALLLHRPHMNYRDAAFIIPKECWCPLVVMAQTARSLAAEEL